MQNVIRTYDEQYEDLYGVTRTFRVQIITDPDAPPPWENADCHGPVTDWVQREANEGEWRLNQDRGWYRYYDAAAAREKAQREGWGGSGDTEEEKIEDAIQKDFAYLKAWCDDEWQYVGVQVFPLSARGDELRSYADAVWGIGSDDPDYIKEISHELMYSISNYISNQEGAA